MVLLPVSSGLKIPFQEKIFCKKDASRIKSEGKTHYIGFRSNLIQKGQLFLWMIQNRNIPSLIPELTYQGSTKEWLPPSVHAAGAEGRACRIHVRVSAGSITASISR